MGPFRLTLICCLTLCAFSANSLLCRGALGSGQAGAASFTAGFSANVDLYDPNGRRLASGTSSLAPPLLTATGRYTAVVGASAARGAGSYAFSWQRLNDPVATPL